MNTLPDGNIFATTLVWERLKELDGIIDKLEMRLARYPGSAKVKGEIWSARHSHSQGVKFLRYLNPTYYEQIKGTLVRQ